MISLRSAAFLLLAASAIPARADLQIHPTRIVLADTVRVANVTLKNLANKAEKYRVRAVFYRMAADGSMEPVDEKKVTPDERPLMKYIRFSPREFTLPSQGEQVVRVMYAGPSTLPDGEYRTHLHLEPVVEKAGEDDEPAAKQGKPKAKIQMTLEAKLAFAVPVLFRHGKVEASTKLERLRVLKAQDGKSTASVDVVWSGNAYPYGEFVAYLTPKGGERAEAGVVRGIAAYTSPRAVSVPLTVPSEKLSGAKLEVVFREPDEATKVFGNVEATLP